MPNFAFSLITDRAPSDAAWDLSHVRAFVNCAEPVRLETWRSFEDRFAPYGLSRLAQATCYAMAETTFAVTFAGAGAPPLADRIDAARFARDGVAISIDDPLREARLMLSSGCALPGAEIRIVDGSGQDVAERHVGSIEVATPFNAVGYWKADGIQSVGFRGRWYATGDVGYFADGHLFVVGRQLDRIIVAGENVFAGDIEEAASRIKGVRPGRIAAFGVPDDVLGTERLIVAAEIVESPPSRDLERIRSDLVRSLRIAANVPAADIVLLPERTLSKTSSGKLERKRIRERYLKQEFRRLRLG